MKRIMMSLLCVAALTMTGCDILQQTTAPSSSIAADSATSSTPSPNAPLPLELLPNGKYYEALRDDVKAHYDRILGELHRFSNTDTTNRSKPALTIHLEPSDNSFEDISKAYRAVYNDHPELFYLQENGATVTTVNGQCTEITVEYAMDLPTRRSVAATYDAVATAWVTDCAGMNDFETERYLHDRLLANCTYNEAAAAPNASGSDYITYSSPYTALCNGTAICGGYARAMQYLLNRAGIEATMVYNDEHVWNMVWIDGEAYHLDPTWNDSDERITHHYFNVTESEIAATRPINTQEFVMPRTTATAANYHTYYGWTYDRQQFEQGLSDIILPQLLEDDGTVEIKITPAYSDDFKAFLQTPAFTEFFYALEQYDNGDAIFDRWSQYSYYATEEIGTFTLIAE